MVNKKNFKVLIILLYFFLNGCQGMKDTFEGKKGNNSDEFLIEKKNPLVLPPEFKNLPEPENSIKKDKEENFDLKSIIMEPTEISDFKKIDKETSIEKSIIEKIKNSLDVN